MSLWCCCLSEFVYRCTQRLNITKHTYRYIDRDTFASLPYRIIVLTAVLQHTCNVFNDIHFYLIPRFDRCSVWVKGFTHLHRICA